MLTPIYPCEINMYTGLNHKSGRMCMEKHHKNFHYSRNPIYTEVLTMVNMFRQEFYENSVLGSVQKKINQNYWILPHDTWYYCFAA